MNSHILFCIISGDYFDLQKLRKNIFKFNTYYCNKNKKNF